MTAKAGSSCRSKGKSSRNRVLKRAVMVSAAGEKQWGVGPSPMGLSPSWAVSRSPHLHPGSRQPRL